MAHGEMVETLEAVVREAEHLVHQIVEVAADAGPARASRLRLEVEDVPEHPRFPEQPPVPPRPACPDRLRELGRHPQAERAVGRDLLLTAHELRDVTVVPLGEEEVAEMLRE